MSPNMFINIPYSEIYHLADFDVLIRSGFKVIQTIASTIIYTRKVCSANQLTGFYMMGNRVCNFI